MGWMNPMEWIGGPQAWFGVLGLTMIEILVGLANVVFIVILANEFPAAQRRRAPVRPGPDVADAPVAAGPGLDWPVKFLNRSQLSVGPYEYTGQHLVLMAGGVLVLSLLFQGARSGWRIWKGAPDPADSGGGAGLRAMLVLFQIVALNAVFAARSVVTASAMASRVEVAMAAMLAAFWFLLRLSRPLARVAGTSPWQMMAWTALLVFANRMDWA